jgi:hypothetical protein
MSIPRLIEGGIQQGEFALLVEHAVVRPDLVVEPRILYNAARTAGALFKTDKPWLTHYTANVSSIDWSRPGTRERQSIWETAAPRRMTSFMECAYRLIAFSCIEPDSIRRLFLHKVPEGSNLPPHFDSSEPDDRDFERSLLLLKGAKNLTFLHGNVSAETTWIQGPGDAYKMQPCQVKHGVDNITFDDTIAIYVEEEI